MTLRWSGGIATTTNLASARPFSLVTADPVVVVIDASHGGLEHHPVAELGRRRVGDLLRAGRETVLLGTVFDVEHPVQTTGRAGVAGGVQHRHVVGFASPGHPRHDGQQVACGGAGAHRPQPLAQRLAVQPGGAPRGPRLAQRNGPGDPLELPTHTADVDADRPATASGWCRCTSGPRRATGSGWRRRGRSGWSGCRARRPAPARRPASGRRTCRPYRPGCRRRGRCTSVRRPGRGPRVPAHRGRVASARGPR